MAIAQEVKAIVRQSKLDDVIEALRGIPGLPGATVSLVRGFGKASADGPQEIGEAAMYKLEIVVEPSMVERAIETIGQAARTGQPGDGKIFVYSVDDVANIRKQLRGAAAI